MIGMSNAARNQEIEEEEEVNWPREWTESLAVALILALLFRGFVAEAFIIPTGSMAPVLTGSHKDLYCQECGARFQTGASAENEDRRHGIVVGCFCGNCRAYNKISFRDQKDSTFSGDRIMVSKFHYALHEPKRWDVIVFKFPENAKQNYIKRLVGLPGETIHIRHGDVFRLVEEQREEILRKPDDKLLAMRHSVYDTKYQSAQLIAAGFPSRWQPWEENALQPPSDSWQVQVEQKNWMASLTSPQPKTRWLRYFHNLPTDREWENAMEKRKLGQISPYRTRAITDFYAYNAYVLTDNPNFPRLFPRGGSLNDIRSSRQIMDLGFLGGRQDGMHWVGDLMLEANVEIGEGDGSLTLDLVKAGRHFQCDFQITTGQARLRIVDEKGTATPLPNAAVQVQTKVSGPGRYQLRFSNFDNQLRVWVNGSRVDFGDTTYQDLPPLMNRPAFTLRDPGDGAPLGIGATNLVVKVSRLHAFRDKYYVASKGRSNFEYDNFNEPTVQEVIRQPEMWSTTNLWASRNQRVKFPLNADQFMPMGDNSPESRDARGWINPYVERNLLTGKALLIFWPHPWYRALPNFSRMSFIR